METGAQPHIRVGFKNQGELPILDAEGSGDDGSSGFIEIIVSEWRDGGADPTLWLEPIEASCGVTKWIRLARGGYTFDGPTDLGDWTYPVNPLRFQITYRNLAGVLFDSYAYWNPFGSRFTYVDPTIPTDPSQHQTFTAFSSRELDSYIDEHMGNNSHAAQSLEEPEYNTAMLAPGDFIRILTLSYMKNVNKTMPTASLDNIGLNTLLVETEQPISLFASDKIIALGEEDINGDWDVPHSDRPTEILTVTNIDKKSNIFRLIEPITVLRDIQITADEENTELELQYYNGSGAKVEAEAIGIYVENMDDPNVPNPVNGSGDLNNRVSLTYFGANQFTVKSGSGINGTMSGGISTRYGVTLDSQVTAGQETAQDESGDTTMWTPRISLMSPNMYESGKKLIMLLVFTQSATRAETEYGVTGSDEISNNPSQQKKVLVLTSESLNGNYVFNETTDWWNDQHSLIIN